MRNNEGLNTDKWGRKRGDGLKYFFVGEWQVFGKEVKYDF